MGLRLRKIIRIAPGVRINLSKSGASMSLGKKGMTVNVGRKGTRATAGAPGTGISYSSYRPYKKADGSVNWLWLVFLLAFLAVAVVIFYR